MDLKFISTNKLLEFDVNKHCGLFIYLKDDYTSLINDTPIEYKRGLYFGGKTRWEYLSLDTLDFGTFGTDETPMVDGIAKVSDIQKIIEDDELVISSSLNNLNDRLDIIESKDLNYGAFGTDETSMVDGIAKVSDVQNIINNINNKIDNSQCLYESQAGDDWLTSAVGGISANKTKSDFEGKTISEMLDAILYPTISPTKTNPSITMKYNETPATNKLIKVGTILPKVSDFGIITNRGTLSFVNSNGDNYYGGEFGEPTYEVKYNNGNYGSISSDDVESLYGNYTYMVSVTCGEGSTPLNNKGEVDENISKYAGGTLTSTMRVTSLYPLFANVNSISEMSELPLDDYYNGTVKIDITIPEERIDLNVPVEEVINGYKFMLEIPNTSTLVSIKQLNKLTNEYSINVNMLEYETNRTGYKGYIRTKTMTEKIGEAQYRIEIKKS